MSDKYFDEELQDELFNWTVYLALVKKRRINLGYTDAKAFARTIYLRTRVSIPGETYYKIERGKQPLKAMQFMALNIALWGTPWPEQVMKVCMGIRWEDIAAHEYPYIDGDWQLENQCRAGLATNDQMAFDEGFSLGVRKGSFCWQDKWLFDSPLIGAHPLNPDFADEWAKAASLINAVAIDEPKGKE